MKNEELNELERLNPLNQVLVSYGADLPEDIPF